MLTLKDTRYEDVRIIFEAEGHTYTDTFGNPYTSMTTLLGSLKPKFDKTYWLRKKARELGMTEKALERQWQSITDEACARGTATHDGIENGIRVPSMFKEAVDTLKRKSGDMVTIADIPNIHDIMRPLNVDDFIELTGNRYPEIYRVLQYYVNQGYKIYAEIGGFLIDYLVSGMIDLLIIREDQFVIGDWKTNRGGLKFESGYFKKDKSTRIAQLTDIWMPTNNTLLAPVTNLPECNGSIYNLQLSGYAKMVEIILGIPCAGLWLCHIDSDFILNDWGQPKRFPDGTYKVKKEPVEKVTMHKMTYLRNEINLILRDQYKKVVSTKVSSNTLFD